MSKIQSVEILIYQALESAFATLDTSVGTLKREARDSESFNIGTTVTEVATVALEQAEKFARLLLELHSKQKGPLVFGKGKFNESLQVCVSNAFESFTAYCYTVVEETSLVTNQKHMYEKEYRNLHQSLDSLKSELWQITAEKNA